MFKFIYDLFLLCFVFFSLPKFLWERIKYKKYRGSVLEKLGLKMPNIPDTGGESSIWIHAVSMGETRGAVSLVKRLQQEYPSLTIFFSTSTETGREEAKRTIPGLAAYFLLPSLRLDRGSHALSLGETGESRSSRRLLG